MTRSPRYYAIRTAVRWAVWTPIALGVYLLACLNSPIL